MTVVKQGHLGGYVLGGDPATYFPDLWLWLVEQMKVRSVVDIGCGEGRSLSFFREAGCDVVGVDGIWQDDPDIIWHDYTQGPLDLGRRLDLAWCCEFVEHVDERFISHFLETFKNADVVLMTHADPGQPGFHHVNCQPREYWIRVMEGAGFSFDLDLTIETRKQAMKNTFMWIDPNTSEIHFNHYLRSGLAFHR